MDSLPSIHCPYAVVYHSSASPKIEYRTDRRPGSYSVLPVALVLQLSAASDTSPGSLSPPPCLSTIASASPPLLPAYDNNLPVLSIASSTLSFHPSVMLCNVNGYPAKYKFQKGDPRPRDRSAIFFKNQIDQVKQGYVKVPPSLPLCPPFRSTDIATSTFRVRIPRDGLSPLSTPRQRCHADQP